MTIDEQIAYHTSTVQLLTDRAARFPGVPKAWVVTPEQYDVYVAELAETGYLRLNYQDVSRTWQRDGGVYLTFRGVPVVTRT